MLANLILDGRLASPYARNLLATIESAYGRCAVEVLAKSAPLSNVIVTCFAGESGEAIRVYVDERNLADIDSARMLLMLRGLYAYELGRTGSSRKVSIEAHLQLVIRRRNAFGKRINVG